MVERLIRRLAIEGDSTARALRQWLGISQPSFSRLMRRAGERVLIAGRGRATRYAARRSIPGVMAPIPVYEVMPPGARPRLLLEFHPVHPTGFYAVFRDKLPGRFYDDLPYFLNDLRPAGFLGRMIPRRHPELGFPEDVQLWSGDHTLRYITEFGWDLVGSLVVGEGAYARLLRHIASPPDVVEASERGAAYADRVVEVQRYGPAGSSAGGEQPKFLTTVRRSGALTPVLVKFSPPADSPASVRTADLLITEHLALDLLRARGLPAARAELLYVSDRTLLEVERFDRVGAQHRLGQISLMSLDAEFVGSDAGRWSDAVRTLVELGVLPRPTLREVRWVELFGQLIANTDMHPGNLAFRTRGLRVTGLAPVYDMLPMLYRAPHGEVIPRIFQPPIPAPSQSDVAPDVLDAALDFWERVSAHERISVGFRAIARENIGRLEALTPLVAMLPTR